MATYNLKSAFYIETASDEIRDRFSGPFGRRFDFFFDVAFPAGGLATSFAAALLLQKVAAPHAYYAVVASLANAFGVLQLLPGARAAYAGAALFGPARTVQWAAYFHFVESRFPPHCVGRLLGYGNLAIALVGDGLPYALAAYVRDAPGTARARYVFPPSRKTSTFRQRYAAVHGVLGVGVAATSGLLVAHLFWQSKKATKAAPPVVARVLTVLDMDGTLLVSRGREIVTDDRDNRAAIHPLIERHVTRPAGATSSYAHCGEEDAHGDPHDLIGGATVVASTAAVLRRCLADPRATVAILTARAHDAAWLAARLEAKLGLETGALPPANVVCVYSREFEARAPPAALASTPARKNAALALLVAAHAPDAVHFYDDDASNVDGARAFFASRGDLPPLAGHLVPLARSLEALADDGVDVDDLLHPQCRDSVGSSNSLVRDLERQLSQAEPEPLRRLSSAGRSSGSLEQRPDLAAEASPP